MCRCTRSLRNGDQVEIIRTKEQTPSPLWEQFVVTGRARRVFAASCATPSTTSTSNSGRNILKKVFADEGTELTDQGDRPVSPRSCVSPSPTTSMPRSARRLARPRVLEAVFPRTQARSRGRKQAAFAEPKIRRPISIRRPDRRHLVQARAVLPTLARRSHRRLNGSGRRAPSSNIDCAELERAQDSMDDWLDVNWGSHAARGGPSVARVQVRVKNVSASGWRR